MEVIQNLFRTIMFFIDKIVYGLIPQIYKLFIYLSQLNLFSGEDNPLQELVNRVYVLLGIFMLFKVSFSLLQYIVDPSAFRDTSKGIGKLVTNVLVALVLLVSVPSIFNFASYLQDILLSNNVIGQLILGSNMSDDKEINTDNVETMAKDVQFMMFGAFYSLNPAVTESTTFSSCKGSDGVFGSRDFAKYNDGACLQQLDTAIGTYEETSANNVDLYSFFKYSSENDRNGNPCKNNICDDRDFGDFDKLLWWKIDGEYVINYLPFISTGAGIYVVFLLITFCVDVAVRVIKLCFLQMIAPIAIVSYIDPKESIGSGKLNSWIKECASTYFSLFLRLAVVFLVIVLISVISSMVLASDSTLGQKVEDITGGDVVFNIWIYLFLIIGAFMFAKQVPKMIESIFDIKGSGELSLNPFKSMGAVRDSGFGTLAGGAIGLGVGATASGIAAAAATRDEGGNAWTTFRRGVGGVGAGAVRGVVAGVRSGGKNTLSKSLDVAGIAGRNAALKTNTTLTQRVSAYSRQAVGMQSKKEGLDKRIGYHDSLAKHASSMKNRATDQLGKKSDKWKWTQQEKANLQEAVKNRHDIHYTDANGNVAVASYNNKAEYEKAFTSEMNKFFNDEQRMISNYINSYGKTDGTQNISSQDDYQLTIEHNAFVKEYNDNKLNYTDNNGQPLVQTVDENIQWEDIDKVSKAAEKEALMLSNSEEYQDAKTLDDSLRSENRQSFWSKQ